MTPAERKALITLALFEDLRAQGRPIMAGIGARTGRALVRAGLIRFRVAERRSSYYDSETVEVTAKGRAAVDFHTGTEAP